MRILWRDLSEDVLRGLVEAFVLREGTDYGPHEHSLDSKVNEVLASVRTGEVVITYDPDTATINLRLAEDS